MRKVLGAVLLIAAFLTFSACSGGDDPATASSIPESAEYNQSDVDFATGMIQHHAQALAMVDLTLGRDLSSELAALAEEIQMAQGPEIETMVDWLTLWGQPVPETVRDHANAHGDGHAGTDAHAPGMMSAEEMAALEAATGPEFERLFLTMMIDHHQGAIEMAGAQMEEGEYADAVALAGQIVEAQTAEIDVMNRLLGS